MRDIWELFNIIFATKCKSEIIPKEMSILKRVEEWEKICHVNTNKKNTIAISMPDKMDFRTRNIIRDKERYYIMIKRTIIQEDLKILTVETPNYKAWKDKWQNWLIWQER